MCCPDLMLIGWWMNWSNKNRLHATTQLGIMAFLAACMVLHAFAQESAHDRYQRAVTLFGSTARGDVEEACDIMKQLVQERPDDQKFQTEKNTFCRQADRMHELEKEYAEQGMQLAKNGKCADARQDYDRISGLSTKDPTYRDRLSHEVSECESRQRGQAGLDEVDKLLRDHKFTEARNALTKIIQKGGAASVKAKEQLDILENTERGVIKHATEALNRGRDNDARALLNQVAADRGPSSDEAQRLLVQIKQTVNDRELLDQAASLVRQGKNSEAQNLLNPVVARGGPLSAKAGALLKQIAGSGEELLRAGLKAYFRGDLEEAESKLTSYISINGERDALAYFFRGAARASRYFLSGEVDVHEKSNAMEDFRTLKQHHRDFRLPLEYVSPKVISLYQSTG